MKHSELTHLIALLDPQASTHIVDYVVDKLSQACISAEEYFEQEGIKARERQREKVLKEWNPNDPTNW